MPDVVLGLKRLYYPRINITANSSHDPSEEISSESFDTGSVVRHTKTEKTTHINYYFKSEEPNDSNLPYLIDMHLYAAFQIDPDLASMDAKLRENILLDIAQLIIGSMREMIASTTSRGPWGAYFIPITDAEVLADALLNSYLLGEKKKKKRPQKKEIDIE
ncbi:hypothetical protein [Pseudomonas chlororaphis]|uniref:hypothetical protein n=1 Tax=Pseudomonas chlororaphis TaxID=587753 RepID=UPI0011CDB602|nr:hypothetical protein [Pseudomonas chlororaphis]